MQQIALCVSGSDNFDCDYFDTVAEAKEALTKIKTSGKYKGGEATIYDGQDTVLKESI